MGRARSREAITRRPVASGSEWAKFRAALWARWGPLVTCAACGHRIAPAGGEVQHQVPPGVRPDLAYAAGNCRPVHGGTYRDGRGDRRCPDPACRLACNAVLAGNHAPRCPDGTPLLPWPAEFLAQKQAEQRARAGGGQPPGGRRRTAGGQATARAAAAPDNGREW
jgi:hypothetical protein